jgi:Raf kinase inhibitor-like YbhB/YbcL family protein
MPLKLTIESFREGADIPVQFTCDGADASPTLRWEGEPQGTMSFAVIMDDADSPGGTFTHWLVWDIPARFHEIPEGKGASAGTPGMNDFGKLGYNGPCPPRGAPHRYFFRLFALNAHTLGLSKGANREALDHSLKDHILTQATYMGRFGRK